MTDPKPIETHWKGYRFRSRLEARWAVFFQRLGLTWEYEPEGFSTSEGPYLPDFVLRHFYPDEQDLWVEIKPISFTSSERKKASQKLLDVLSVTGGKGIIVQGDPYLVASSEFATSVVAHQEGWALLGWDSNDQKWTYLNSDHAFCICLNCGRVGLEYDGWSERICEGACKGSNPNGHKERTHNHPRILRAAKAARSARFEFGESPA